uniref:(California timema) hypothetical protein n=1 Tax=Timema californicum TaxID=61474 RepID=A0A7R9PAU9_TIMCA|nr:unnamed protein product [Timema californicum]
MRKVILYLLKVYPHLQERRAENHFGKNPFSTPDRDSKLDLPIIGNFFYCKSRALEDAATDLSVSVVKTKPNQAKHACSVASQLFGVLTIAYRNICAQRAEQVDDPGSSANSYRAKDIENYEREPKKKNMDTGLVGKDELMVAGC